jgi:hypothetical protein
VFGIAEKIGKIMKGRSLFSLIVSVGILGVSSAPSFARTTITLPAKNACVDSKVIVSIGDSIQFSAIGQASYGHEDISVNNTPFTNPDGDRFVNGVNISKTSDSKQQNTISLSQQLTRCIKWSTFAQSLIETKRRTFGRVVFKELPDGFKQGCVFFQQNNSLDIAYVLKDGIKPSSTLTNGLFYDYYGGVPSFGFGDRDRVSDFRAELSQQSLENLMSRGQALMITWLTPTNGAIPYLNSIPKDRAFVRKDGMVCFWKVCMKSSAVSNEELMRILEAGHNSNRGRSPAKKS